jgi:hypothetical protein
MRRDADILSQFRAVRNAKNSDFKDLIKQLTEKGG